MKILMVCLGNICRSPLAEGILRKMCEENSLNVEVDSAGVESFHAGEAPDYRTQKNALSHGLNISGLRARKFVKNDFEKFDKIYVMDESVYNYIISLAGNPKDKEKVSMIMDVLFEGENISVPDPYLGGDSGFEEVYQLLFGACSEICKDISN